MSSLWGSAIALDGFEDRAACTLILLVVLKSQWNQAVGRKAPLLSDSSGQLLCVSAMRLNFDLWESPSSALRKKEDFGSIPARDDCPAFVDGLSGRIHNGLVVSCLRSTGLGPDCLQDVLCAHVFDEFDHIVAGELEIHRVARADFLGNARFVVAALD